MEAPSNKNPHPIMPKDGSHENKALVGLIKIGNKKAELQATIEAVEAELKSENQQDRKMKLLVLLQSLRRELENVKDLMGRQGRELRTASADEQGGTPSVN